MNSTKARIQLLNKISKVNKTLTPLNGKATRKDIEKQLKACRDLYDQNYTELKEYQAQLSRIENIIADKRSKVDASKSEMARCYDLLHSMDRVGSDLVRLDRADVAFAKDSHWYYYDKDNDNLRLYREYKKEQQSADDFLNDELDDGADIIKE